MSNGENRRQVSSRTNPQSMTITSSLQAGARAVEKGNYDWMSEAKTLIDYDQTVEAPLGFWHTRTKTQKSPGTAKKEDNRRPNQKHFTASYSIKRRNSQNH